jgi:ribose 5-phosphate isomerase
MIKGKGCAKYSNKIFLKKGSNKIMIIGDISIPPKLGNIFLIGLSNGSVSFFDAK